MVQPPLEDTGSKKVGDNKSSNIPVGVMGITSASRNAHRVSGDRTMTGEAAHKVVTLAVQWYKTLPIMTGSTAAARK